MWAKIYLVICNMFKMLNNAEKWVDIAIGRPE